MATVYRFGIFELEVESSRLLRRGREIKIQEKPFQLLAVLLEHAGEVVGREQLRERLWPSDTFVQFDDNLNTTVKRVREALSDSADRPRYVETVPRKGYRFIPPVERLSADTEEPARKGRPWWPWTMVAVAALAIGVGSWWTLRAHSSSSTKMMLAVLPFRNVGGSAEQDYLSDGLTEELTAHLGRMAPRKLGVISRSSVAQFQRRAEDVQRIGQELGVRYVLEGSVGQVDGEINVTAQLVEAHDRTHVWAETYARPASELLKIERDVARAVAEALAIRLLPAEESALARAGTTNTAAYDAYLAGMYQWDRGTEQSFRNALSNFEQAVALDPGYGLAHTGIAKTYLELAAYRFVPADEAYRQAQEHVAMALRVDDSLPEAHSLSAALLEKTSPNSPGIGEAYRKAIELNPSAARVRRDYAFYLLDQKQPAAAVLQTAEAVRLDPLSASMRCYHAWILFCAERFREAQEQVSQASAVDPNYPFALYIQGHLFLHDKKWDAAIAQFQRAVAASGRTPKYLNALAGAYLKAGRKGEARELLAELERQSKTKYVPPDFLRRLRSEIENTPTLTNLAEPRP
jgi:TolB-like protein/DNA-binding winged helix-turn-helix (wHTH) protein/Tfp pilus assembly protein PilF